MKNVNMKVEGTKLTIEVDLEARHGRSASGKTTIIATTAGNVSVPGHEDILVGSVSTIIGFTGCSFEEALREVREITSDVALGDTSYGDHDIHEDCFPESWLETWRNL